jgi:RimJ/RimL family protein N-acetyltransferase
VTDVHLRAVERRDLDFTRRHRSDPEINRAIDGRRFPATDHGELAWFESLGNGAFPTSAVFIICVDGSDDPRGLVQLTDIDWVNRTSSLGIWLIDEARGSGVASGALEAIAAYGGDRLNLRRIKLRVLADNESAIRLYERNGFVEEGRLSGDVLRDGVAHDVLLMARDLTKG